MTKREMCDRTRKFNTDVINFCSDFPRNAAGFEVAKQLIRSAGSVGANYRALLRSKSRPDFINKLAIVLEESDESHYWLEIIRDTKMKTTDDTNRLINEANELTAIFAAMLKTTKQRK
ncbi:MAG: four helix bundle protein [Bacteroidota bacterium]|nr:four helix bundle protein [Bacteroidota bacterium]